MNISLTEKQEKYIISLIKSENFKNANEVVRDAIRLHQNKYRIIDDLRAEIAKGWSGETGLRSPSQIAQDKLKSQIARDL